MDKNKEYVKPIIEIIEINNIDIITGSVETDKEDDLPWSKK